MKKYMYIFTITYSFDVDYFAKKFDTFEEAVECLNKTLQEEKEIVMTENEYEPSIIRYTQNDVVFVYAEGLDDDYFTEDRAYYRIFEVEI